MSLTHTKKLRCEAGIVVHGSAHAIICKVRSLPSITMQRTACENLCEFIVINPQKFTVYKV